MMFDDSARMVEASPELKTRVQVVQYQKRIVCPSRNGVIRANSADAPNKDGLNPLAALFDELHRQPDRKLWEVFEYAGAARDEPIIGSITTAGEDETGPWFEQRDYSEKVARGDVTDTTHLGIVYRALPEDDIDDPATWRRANPSMGLTIKEEDFRRELNEAKLSPVSLANFKRLRLNIVCREAGLFLSPEQWAACGPADGRPVKLDPAMFRGKPCYAGADLSTTTDLSALVAVWGDTDDGLDVVCWFYLPEDNIVALERRDRMAYRALAEQGWITLTPGNVIDYGFIRRDVNALAADHDLRKLLMDPYNASQLMTELAESDGVPVQPLRQGYISMNSPTKELLRLVLAGKLRHHGNPVLRWMAGNAVAARDAAGNVKLDKSKSRLKIDGMAALVNAVCAATSDADGGGRSVYEDRGVLLL